MKRIGLLVLAISTFFACQKQTEKSTEFEWKVDRFADVQILRYQIPGWEELTPKQRVYVYYLTQAGLAGRDIIWDQNYRHNLSIRKALEGIIEHYPGKRKGADWDNFMTYAKRVFFSNGIHHHYSMLKFKPEFSQEYFEKLMKESGVALDRDQLRAMFDPNLDPKKVNLDPDKGLIIGSAVNFYAHDLMDDEVEAFYQFQKENAANPLWSYGINSRMRRGADGALYEDVYKVGGALWFGFRKNDSLPRFGSLCCRKRLSGRSPEDAHSVLSKWRIGALGYLQHPVDAVYRWRH
jgi:dipeptidyl-peptidase III